MSNLMIHMRTSAEAGNAEAQFNLAVILGNGFDDRGRFIGEQREEALSWLRKAAEAGLCRAQCKLAQTFAEGDTPQQEEACAWFLVALDNTDGGSRQAARDGYERIMRVLQPDQLERAQANAKAWITRIKTGRDKRERAINALAKSASALKPL